MTEEKDGEEKDGASYGLRWTDGLHDASYGGGHGDDVRGEEADGERGDEVQVQVVSQGRTLETGHHSNLHTRLRSIRRSDKQFQSGIGLGHNQACHIRLQFHIQREKVELGWSHTGLMWGRGGGGHPHSR